MKLQTNKKMEWIYAPDVKKELNLLIKKLQFFHIDINYIFCFRSFGSKSHARARIWSLPRVWQLALKVKPHYIIEILSEKFDKLNYSDQTRTLIHELMHIPKSFSGALVVHRGRFHRINPATVEKLFKQYQNDD